MFYPYKFAPILTERVWGGQTLARYGKPIPPGQHIGESWEISDRDDAQSVVTNGPDRGKTLRQLIEAHDADAIIGRARPPGAPSDRFPLLIKLLDARERLSLQVHPPPSVARQLGGDPKTEMWYIIEADPGATLIAGLRREVTRQQFEAAIQKGGTAFQACFHQFPVRAGDCLFVPSGRLHAIGAGLIIAEIQQSSDTTYRVYDWDRVGTDGKPRALHIRESLASINFDDFEPQPTPLPITCEFFSTELLRLDVPYSGRCDGRSFHVLGCVAGAAEVAGQSLNCGEFALLPAALGEYTVNPKTKDTKILKTKLP